MLPQKRRINKDLFKKILKTRAFVVSSPSFRAVFGVLPNKGDSKFSCVCSKKEVPQAIKRNEVKRKCYRSIYFIYKDIKKDSFGIFYLKKNSLVIPYHDFKEEIKESFKKAKLLVP